MLIALEELLLVLCRYRYTRRSKRCVKPAGWRLTRTISVPHTHCGVSWGARDAVCCGTDWSPLNCLLSRCFEFVFVGSRPRGWETRWGGVFLLFLFPFLLLLLPHAHTHTHTQNIRLLLSERPLLSSSSPGRIEHQLTLRLPLRPYCSPQDRWSSLRRLRPPE